VRVERVVFARFEEEHLVGWIFRETAGDDAACGTAADDNDII
jgi:hypothetical protein